MSILSEAQQVFEAIEAAHRAVGTQEFSLEQFLKDFGSLLALMSVETTELVQRALEMFEGVVRTAVVAAEESWESWQLALRRVSALAACFRFTKDLFDTALAQQQQQPVSSLVKVLLMCIESMRALLRWPAGQLAGLLQSLDPQLLGEITRGKLGVISLCFVETRAWGVRLGEVARAASATSQATDPWVKEVLVQLDAAYKAAFELLKEFISPFHDMEPPPDRLKSFSMLPLFRSSLLTFVRISFSGWTCLRGCASNPTSCWRSASQRRWTLR